jgi:hypothetical protein
LQWLYAWSSNVTTLEWLSSFAWSLTGWSALAVTIFTITRWVDGGRPLRPIGIAELIRSLGHGATKAEPLARTFGLVRALFLTGMTYIALGLAYDGRGRDFPIAMALFPIIGLSIVELISPRRATVTRDREESLLAFILFATSVFVAYHETYLNPRAMMWCALCMIFAATIGVGQWRSLNPNERAEQQPDPA